MGDVGEEWGGEVAFVRATFVEGLFAFAVALDCSSSICRSSSDNALLKLSARLVVLVLVGVVGFVGLGFGARLNRLDGSVVGVGRVACPLLSLL